MPNQKPNTKRSKLRFEPVRRFAAIIGKSVALCAGVNTIFDLINNLRDLV